MNPRIDLDPRARAATVVMVASLVLVGLVPSVGAQSTVDLQSADPFAILAGSTVTNTGPSVINGDVGLHPGTSVTGFNQATVNGDFHVADGVAQQAKDDLTTAYNDAAGRPGATTIGTELGNQLLKPGVYDSASGTFEITGPLTLDAQGDKSAVWIFQMQSTLTTASKSSVNLINGAQACNVFWQVGSSATLGTGTDFRGNILAQESITLNNGAAIDGRALARSGAVTLDTNVISIAECEDETAGGSADSDTSVEKIARQATVPLGDDAVFDITVTANGPNASENVTLNDDLPGTGWTLSGPDAGDCQPFNGSQLSCEFGTLAENETRTVTVTRATTLDDCGTLSNAATVTSDEDADPINNADSDQITVECPDLSVEKTSDARTVPSGEAFNFTIAVTNEGNVTATDVEVTDTIPDGLTIVSTSPECSVVGQDVTCQLGDIAPGDTETVVIQVQPEPGEEGIVENTAEASASNEPDDTLDDNEDTVRVNLGASPDRANFAHRPFQTPEGFNESFLGGPGLYMNELDSPHTNLSVRLYSNAGLHAPSTWANASDLHDRTAIPSDSVVFNPALIQDLEEFGSITGCEGDAHLKKYLRAWYEPGRELNGSRVDSGAYEATEADVIQVESTYRLIDASSYTPTNACEGSQFPFPTQGVHLEDGDGHEQPGLDQMTNVTVGQISGTGTAGTVELEQEQTFEIGDSLQFLDHRVTFRGLVTDLDGQTHAQIDVEYLGNTYADAQRTVDLRERQYFTRSNTAHGDALHDAGSDTRTFYAELVNVDEDDESATLLVGKELQQGDIFYVDGVRYEVPAIHVVPCQTDEACVKSISLRTPLPKSDPEGSWTSVTDDTREEEIDGQFQVQDNSEVTTQWIVEADVDDPIPVDPPFNRDTYTMVDDTDVQLWEQGEANEETNFPYGPPEDSVPDGDGMPMFPEGERYLTMEDPPQDWIDFFDAQPTGFNDTGSDHADSLPQRLAEAGGINHDAWAPSGLTGPHAFNETRVNFTWIREAFEGRHSKNVLELREDDAFTAETDPTLPDSYTEFQLPNRPNPVSRLEAELSFDSPCSRMDVVPGGQDCNATYQLLGGDYLVTTSFRLQDGETRHAFAVDPDDNTDATLPGNEHSLDDVDLYFNERDLTAIFGGQRPDVADVTARLYGEEGEVNQAPGVFLDPSDAFDATVIPKDSATFNPAIVRHLDEGSGTITACGEDAHLKKHLRLWYEPEHAYDGPRIDGTTATTADVIQVESTYQLIDASSYRPVDACANTSSFPFPTTGASLEEGDGHEQPGLDTLETVRVGDVSGSGARGTVELEREIRLSVGEDVQFLDHRVELLNLVQTVDSGDQTEARLNVSYVGNYQGSNPGTQTHDLRDRVYFTRANDAFATPAHDAGSSTRTFYVELVSFDEGDDTATLLVGKEIQAGDTFYVDGVRYDVPGVAVDDGRLEHVTLRSPLPKSDPGGTWTSVTDPTREEFVNGQWQVEDPSQVTTQFLVQVDNKDPIPVDPPFNQDTYTMVDDTDVQLWQPTANEDTFPLGPTDESLPEGTGTPMFPDGERYLTMADPSDEWAEFFDIEPTGYLESGDSYADETPLRFAQAAGINHDAWERQGDDEPPTFNEENVTFYWLKEWYEGRYSSNQLELPDGEVFRGEQIQTRPDRYTEFVLPDRPNPVSLTDGTLAYGDDPDCTRTDVVDQPDCQRTVPLLGGDYAILTSLVEPSAQRESASASESSSPDTHAYDANGDCVMSDDEVLALVADWGDGEASDDQVLSGVAAWGMAPDAYC